MLAGSEVGVSRQVEQCEGRCEPMEECQQTKFKVLIVENSVTTVKVITQRLEQEKGFPFEVAESYAQVEALLGDNPLRFFVAIVDLHLADAPNGEVVDLVISKNIPPIILSAFYQETVRSMIMEKPIVDYVVKRNYQELDYLFSVVQRVRENLHRKVMVVDDSRSCRLVLSRYLSRQSLTVIEADSAEAALVTLEQNPDVCLIITDENMGGMSGAEMIVQIRSTHPRNELAIIGVSATDNKSLNALFLKSGANDFFAKPFSYEELFCRVAQNIDAVVLQRHLRESASLDAVTGCYSRKYLMRTGELFHQNYQRNNVQYVICCVKILGFEALNDEHGPHVGEAALCHASSRLTTVLRQTDILARVGGAEFCLLCIGVELKTADIMLSRLIQSIERSAFECDEQSFYVKVYAYVSYPRCDTFRDCLKDARQMLLDANTKHH